MNKVTHDHTCYSHSWKKERRYEETPSINNQETDFLILKDLEWEKIIWK